MAPPTNPSVHQQAASRYQRSALLSVICGETASYSTLGSCWSAGRRGPLSSLSLHILILCSASASPSGLELVLGADGALVLSVSLKSSAGVAHRWLGRRAGAPSECRGPPPRSVEQLSTLRNGMAQGVVPILEGLWERKVGGSAGLGSSLLGVTE